MIRTSDPGLTNGNDVSWWIICLKYIESFTQSFCDHSINRMINSSRSLILRLCFNVYTVYRDTVLSVAVATWRKHLPYLFATLFSEELLQRRDVVSLNFWKLYIPYRIDAFSRRYETLSRISSVMLLMQSIYYAIMQFKYFVYSTMIVVIVLWSILCTYSYRQVIYLASRTPLENNYKHHQTKLKIRTKYLFFTIFLYSELKVKKFK
jgi:hypothetical protein